uniref:Uncharacterized protein n=1 Tax=Rheinheimera sp. BAL341 TaxID=1708203 RepID=A0A486XWI2_9GAMM
MVSGLNRILANSLAGQAVAYFIQCHAAILAPLCNKCVLNTIIAG